MMKANTTEKKRMVQLCESIAQELPADERVAFWGSVSNAIENGTDTKLVWHKFAHWLLIDPEHGVIRFAKDNERIRDVIVHVADLHMRCAQGDQVTQDEWSIAEWAAESAAWDAASDAAWVARSTARVTESDAVRWVARWAARVAARAARVAAAKDTHYRVMADKLIEILNDLSGDDD
jgi:hypothetical protein